MIDKKEKYMQDILNMFPKTIGIELTTYCPLDCIYCNRKYVERKDMNLEWDELKILIDKLENFDNFILCGIGEPMVYPHLYKLVHNVKKNFLIVTSGHVKVNFKELNKNRNIKVVVFSVDAPSAEKMKEIASSYNWDNMLENVRAAKKSGVPIVVINSTVTGMNYLEVPKVITLAKELGVLAVNFTMDLNGSCDNVDGIEKVRRYIKELKKDPSYKNIMINISYESLKCVSWNTIVPYITVEGNLYPCCVGVKDEYQLGNIFDKSFEEIWDNKEYCNFRKGDLCKTCRFYHDYEFGN